MSKLKNNILFVVETSVKLSKKYSFNHIIYTENEIHAILNKTRKPKSIYHTLDDHSDTITILRHLCRHARTDLLKGKYTRTVTSLINEFCEMFHQTTIHNSFDEKKSFNKVIRRSRPETLRATKK